MLYLVLVPSMGISMLSHLEVNARFDKAGPRRELVDCCCEGANIRSLLAGTPGWLFPTTVTTENGGGGSGCL